jgi:hypothetical protein
MARKLSLLFLLFVLGLVAVGPAYAGRGDGPIIYVKSQDLYYDSILTADELPMQGPFQKLEMGESGLQTEHGPGDQAYVGGRWWLDLDGDNIMEETDKFFSCPLLGPGRDTP